MKAIEHLMEIIRVIDQELKGKKFFGGESIGYLDLVFGWMAFWLGIAEEVASFKVVDSKKFPNFTSWINNFINDPLIRGNLPPRDKTLEFFRNFRKLHLASCKWLITKLAIMSLICYMYILCPTSNIRQCGISFCVILVGIRMWCLCFIILS